MAASTLNLLILTTYDTLVYQSYPHHDDPLSIIRPWVGDHVERLHITHLSSYFKPPVRPGHRWVILREEKADFLKSLNPFMLTNVHSDVVIAQVDSTDSIVGFTNDDVYMMPKRILSRLVMINTKEKTL